MLGDNVYIILGNQIVTQVDTVGKDKKYIFKNLIHLKSELLPAVYLVDDMVHLSILCGSSLQDTNDLNIFTPFWRFILFHFAFIESKHITMPIIIEILKTFLSKHKAGLQKHIIK